MDDNRQQAFMTALVTEHFVLQGAVGAGALPIGGAIPIIIGANLCTTAAAHPDTVLNGPVARPTTPAATCSLPAVIGPPRAD